MAAELCAVSKENERESDRERERESAIGWSALSLLYSFRQGTKGCVGALLPTKPSTVSVGHRAWHCSVNLPIGTQFSHQYMHHTLGPLNVISDQDTQS